MTVKQTLLDVNEDKLRDGVRMMCEWLNIPGSIANLYNLYKVVFREQDRAFERKAEINKILEEHE